MPLLSKQTVVSMKKFVYRSFMMEDEGLLNKPYSKEYYATIHRIYMWIIIGALVLLSAYVWLYAVVQVEDNMVGCPVVEPAYVRKYRR